MATHRSERPTELLILRDQAGTSAQAEVIRSAYGRIPNGMVGKVIGPGESCWGHPFEFWLERVGQDVPLHQRPAVPTSRETAMVTPLLEGDWRNDPEISAVPAEGAEFGYFTGEHAIAATREQVIAQCVAVPATPRVWTPDSPGLVRPEEVPELVTELRFRRLARSRRTMMWLGAAVLLILVPAFRWPGALLLLLLSAGYLVAGFVFAAYEYRSTLGGTQHVFAAARLAARHRVWLKQRTAHTARVIAGILVAAYLVGEFGRRQVSIEMAGLVKEAVWRGEWWRLLTVGFLHGSISHLWANCAALLWLGRVVEVHVGRAWTSIVFVLSVLGGALASLLLMPHTTSVGASGGVMGLVGFLMVAATRRPEEIPVHVREGALLTALATAALGLVGFMVIDNAAHAGGFVTGGAIAWLALRPGGERGLRVAEATAWLGIIAAALFAIHRMTGPEALMMYDEYRAERFRR